MATTINTTEGTPEAYPDPPAGLSEAAAALSADMVWQRIEAYVAWRSTERDVVWIVEGCGEWEPTLKPATIATTEWWNGAAWEAVELSPSPLGGYVLPGVGPFRLTGAAGDDDADVPAVVLEAFRRVAEYWAAASATDKPGARSQSVNVDELRTESVERSAAWMAQALVNSGAADLLRNYRRA